MDSRAGLDVLSNKNSLSPFRVSCPRSGLTIRFFWGGGQYLMKNFSAETLPLFRHGFIRIDMNYYIINLL